MSATAPSRAVPALRQPDNRARRCGARTILRAPAARGSKHSTLCPQRHRSSGLPPRPLAPPRPSARPRPLSSREGRTLGSVGAAPPQPACVPPQLDVRTTNPSRLCGARRRRLEAAQVPSRTCFWSSAELSTQSKRDQGTVTRLSIGIAERRSREKRSWSNSPGVMGGLGTRSSLPSAQKGGN